MYGGKVVLVYEPASENEIKIENEAFPTVFGDLMSNGQGKPIQKTVSKYIFNLLESNSLGTPIVEMWS